MAIVATSESFTNPSTSSPLMRRKGGGGGHGSSGHAGGSESSSSGKSSSGSGSSSGKSRSVTSFGKTSTISSSSKGVSKVSVIPSGSFFAGRHVGGGTRDNVYGTQVYGSGYPGLYDRGVYGRDFPYYFWPVVWYPPPYYGPTFYLYPDEYGQPDNSSRTGSSLMTAAFQGNISTFRIIADNTTVVALIDQLGTNCSNVLVSHDAIPTAYSNSSGTSRPPRPEEVIQYYRASSAALTLDGYNDTSVFAGNGTASVPIPSNVDAALLNCLNSTIGENIALMDGGSMLNPSISLICLIWLMITMLTR